MACHRDIGHLLVVTSDESSLVLLEGAILEFPVEYPTDFDAGHVWYYLTDVVGLESPPCPLLLSIHHLAHIEESGSLESWRPAENAIGG